MQMSLASVLLLGTRRLTSLSRRSVPHCRAGDAPELRGNRAKRPRARHDAPGASLAIESREQRSSSATADDLTAGSDSLSHAIG